MRILFSLLWLPLVGCATAPAHSGRETARAVVVTGLTPAVVFEGEATPQWTLAERMRRYRVPAVSIAVIDQGRLAWSGAYGQRDGQLPATTNTLFQAASLSKPVAAAVALLLVDGGVLDMDAGINTQLRDWTLPASEGLAPDSVTLRGLLSHGAGINLHGFDGYPAGATLPNNMQILDGLAPANSPPVRLIQAPGTSYRYSGGGYQIAQQAMHDATGQPFDRLARERLLSPLGMNHTVYAADPPQAWRADLAVGHGEGGRALADGWHRYPELAAAGLWSTPTDLATFLIALMDAWNERTHTLLPTDIARLMMTPTASTDQMGLGLGVHGTGPARLVDHGGATDGYRTYMALYPERGQGVVIMTNGGARDELIFEIRRSLAHAYGWPDFAPERFIAAPLGVAVFDALAGQYRVIEAGFTLTLRREGNQLVAETPRGASYRFRAVSSRRFIAIEDGAELEFDAADPDRLQVWGMHAQRQ